MYNETKLREALNDAIQELDRQARPDPFARSKGNSENNENAVIQQQAADALEVILKLEIVKALGLNNPKD